MKRSTVIIALAAALAFTAAASADVKIVVNASNPVESLTKDRVADIFLKKVTRWDNGKAIVPVDLAEKNTARDQFSKIVLKKEVPWVESYWQKMIFSGRATPPAKLNTDAEVLDFVRGNADAVGYVSDTTALPPAVKAIAVKE